MVGGRLANNHSLPVDGLGFIIGSQHGLHLDLFDDPQQTAATVLYSTVSTGSRWSSCGRRAGMEGQRSGTEVALYR